jgi:AcrR family transcriptional regulator
MGAMPEQDSGDVPSTSEASLDERIIDAGLRCLTRWGIAKTTIDDVAREAGCSRATVYRAFPGGKDSVLEAVAAAELRSFTTALRDALDGAGDLEDLLVTAVVTTSRALRDHDALAFLLAHEPETVLPHLAFRRLDPILAVAVAIGSPYLAAHVGEAAARAGAEWVARVVLSHALAPSVHVDLCDADDVRRLVRNFLLPGISRSMAASTN